MKPVLVAFLISIALSMPAALFAGDCGDVDNSGGTNMLDILYLIGYLYKGGPEPDCGTVTDIDGNVYQTVTIGNQVWMAENLKVTHYRNGDPIPRVTDDGDWSELWTGAYCNYNNDGDYVGTYGRLYNWYAVDDSRNIAPEGWHVPTDAEWQTLVDYLGGDMAAGGKMKEAGTAHWQFPNDGATNESGFTALPGGYRIQSGPFASMHTNAHFWSSTLQVGFVAWERVLDFYFPYVGRDFNYTQCGLSVRCVRD